MGVRTVSDFSERKPGCFLDLPSLFFADGFCLYLIEVSFPACYVEQEADVADRLYLWYEFAQKGRRDPDGMPAIAIDLYRSRIGIGADIDVHADEDFPFTLFHLGTPSSPRPSVRSIPSG